MTGTSEQAETAEGEQPSRSGKTRPLLAAAQSLGLPAVKETVADLARAQRWAEAEVTLPQGTVIGSRYAIERRVGSGAFGEVYRAQDTEVPGHVVALKLLHHTSDDEEAKRAALRELHLIASVFHPSIVQFKDHGWHRGRLWFVMPWYEGETLEARIARRPLGRAEARRIFEPLARALATMHAAGIRHQDVKPENIFLARIRGFGREEDDEEVLPVLIDLGVAAKEAEMVLAGTPEYLAPEVAAQFAMTTDARPVTEAADVFALALALRNALEPTTQETAEEEGVDTFVEHRSRHIPPMPRSRGLRFLEPWLRRWMSADPEQRPTADQLAEELSVLTRPEERKRRIVSLLRWVGPTAVAVLAVFASVVYVLDARAEHQEQQAREARTAASNLRQDLKMTREQREDLENNVEELRTQYEKSRLSRQQLTDELANKEGRLKVVRRRLYESRKRRRELDQTLREKKHELDEAETRIAALERKVENKDGRVDALRARARTLRGDLNETRQQLASRQDELDRAERRLAWTQNQLDERKRVAKSARKRVSALRSELQSVKRELAELERRAARAREERDQAQTRVEQLRAKLGDQ